MQRLTTRLAAIARGRCTLYLAFVAAVVTHHKGSVQDAVQIERMMELIRNIVLIAQTDMWAREDC